VRRNDTQLISIVTWTRSPAGTDADAQLLIDTESQTVPHDLSGVEGNLGACAREALALPLLAVA
jgi:hypothetical protein